MKVLILTLTGQRDKFIDKLLAEHLRKYGHEVLVHNYINAGKQSVPYEKPDVVIHPMPGGQFKFDFVKQCKEWGCEVIVRRGEAGASRKSFEKMSKDRQTIIIGNWDYSPYVDLELTWGQEFTGLLAERGCMPANELRACGAFAFDPYFQPDSKRNYKEKRTILFATGFSTADCRVEFCECGLPEDSGFHKEIYEQHRKGRDIWIRSIQKLHSYFGDEWDFELKVRPGEMVGEYLEKLGDIVKVHPQISPSSEVLRNVNLLVHSGSTMAIEAHLLGISAFNFFNVNPDEMVADVSPRVDSYEQLEWELARANLRQSNINTVVYRQLQNHLYGPIDGRACERAAKYIHDHIKNREIKTNIPDKWPAIPKYHEDKQQIHLVKQSDDISWLCPCCKERYYVSKGIELAKCPFCGMTIALVNYEKEKPSLIEVESVLK